MAFDSLDPPKLYRAWHTPCFENLNKLEWPYGFSAICFGVRIGVRSNNLGLLETLHDLLPADAKPYHGKIVDHYISAVLGGANEGSRTRRFHLLYGNHDLVYRGHDLDRLLAAFDPAVRMAVAALAPRRVSCLSG